MKTVLSRFILTGLIAACAQLALAQTSMVPSAMSYQGVLTDDQGNVVAATTPENKNVEFRIYSVASGGTALWAEAQTVTVYKGNFSVILGNGTAIGQLPSGPTVFANVFTNAASADLYFGISQGGTEFSPRQKLLSSAFALRAKVAESVNGVGQPIGSPAQFNAATANLLTINGTTKITSSNALELGAGVADKNSDAGKIIYQGYSQGLDIIGAGTTNANRKLTLWAEGGTQFKGPISFGRYEQSINLNDSVNGVGSQNGGMYLRSYENIGFFRGGVHNDGSLNAGTGGSVMAVLGPSGFTLNTGKFTGDGSGLTNLVAPSQVNYLGVNGTNSIEFGRGIAKGAGNGYIYYGGDNTLNIQGGGTAANFSDRKIILHAQGGLTLYGSANFDGSISTGAGFTANGGSFNIGNNRLGQHINLYSNTCGIGIQNNATYFRVAATDSFNWYLGGSHSDANNNAGGGDTISNWNNSRCDFYRRVYIGASPTDGQVPLTIAGQSTFQNTGNIARFWNPGNGGAGYNGNSNFSTFISIRASAAVVASEFIATSDLRLKLPEGRSDAARDLQTLGALEITDYTMKDKSVDGGRKHKKLIAQQVEKVFPQAVTVTKGTVPDIFRVATAKNGVIAFNDATGPNVKAGETVRLVQGARDLTTEVTGVSKDGFTVKDSIKDGETFVYGHQVEDLRVVDYDAISMLNVSATQELSRKLEKQAAELAAVRQERDALAQEVSALRQSASQQEQQLARIEEKIAALAGRSSAPVAVKAKFDRQ